MLCTMMIHACSAMCDDALDVANLVAIGCIILQQFSAPPMVACISIAKNVRHFNHDMARPKVASPLAPCPGCVQGSGFASTNSALVRQSTGNAH
ncbi:hypothetical protein KL932_000125 [Ogataea haglerorum]|nr:hypothetical protein KL932_000125 [Ogataea haglerorum]